MLFATTFLFFLLNLSLFFLHVIHSKPPMPNVSRATPIILLRAAALAFIIYAGRCPCTLAKGLVPLQSLNKNRQELHASALGDFNLNIAIE